jgi:trk system potassium uptake protein TrkA
MKSILVIGMGKFGHLLCHNLLELGNELMIVDQNEECISDMIYEVTNAQIGDCTNPQVIKSLGVANFDMVIICIGANFQNSLEITSLVKEMGAKWVISKANREVHAKFLLRNGADEVVYPDKEIAQQIAKQCSAKHVFDYVELGGKYSIYEIEPPEEWIGHSIVDLKIRQNYNVSIIGIRKGEEIDIMPDIHYTFCHKEHAMVLGTEEDIKAIIKNLD